MEMYGGMNNGEPFAHHQEGEDGMLGTDHRGYHDMGPSNLGDDGFAGYGTGTHDHDDTMAFAAGAESGVAHAHRGQDMMRDPREVQRDYQGVGGEDPLEEEEEEDFAFGGDVTDVMAITQHASNHLEKTLGETRDLAVGLFQALADFLSEASDVHKELKQVDLAVRSESARLDSLQPEVDSATRSVAYKRG